MTPRNQRLRIVLRVFILTGLTLLFSHLLHRGQYVLLPVFIGLMVVGTVVELVLFLDKTNRYLATFLQAIRFSDFSRNIVVEGLGSSYDELRDTFAKVIRDFQDIRAEREEQAQCLDRVIQHVDVGLIAFDGEDRVSLINRQAQDILQLNVGEYFVTDDTREEITRKIRELGPGEKARVRATLRDETREFVLAASEIILRQTRLKLVSIQDIHSEMEAQELESWQKLIRVLTHEIMNSITPITSLSATITALLDQLPDHTEREDLADIRGAVQTIQRRSVGLLNFVESYRKITRLPKPVVRPIMLNNVLQQTLILSKGIPGAENVVLECVCEPVDIRVVTDPELLEQALINLMKNAIEAMGNHHEGRVRLKGSCDETGKIILNVWDNGPGIKPEDYDRVFVPFYTTRKNGSGIGLSVVRQIAHSLRGTVTVLSQPGHGTIFTISLPGDPSPHLTRD